jgi:hypothetical protein
LALARGRGRVGQEVIAEKTKYRLLSRHQNAGPNCDIKTANRSFENNIVQIFGKDSIAIQYLIQAEIKSLNSGNVCYQASRIFFRLEPKNVKIRIYKTIILPMVFMCAELHI